LTRAARRRVAVGDERADVRLPEQVALDAADEEVLALDDRQIAGPDVEDAMSVRPTVPVSLMPASIGTSRPPNRPICRLKNGNTSAPCSGMPPAGSGPVLAKPKTPAPCRKNARFSGKSTEKRDRLICRASTSVSPKSVLSVAVSLRLDVML
jgi:hypothetical protein